MQGHAQEQGVEEDGQQASPGHGEGQAAAQPSARPPWARWGRHAAVSVSM